MKHTNKKVYGNFDILIGDKGGEVYKPVCFCDQPTITFENVKTGERKTWVIESGKFDEYTVYYG